MQKGGGEFNKKTQSIKSYIIRCQIMKRIFLFLVFLFSSFFLTYSQSDNHRYPENKTLSEQIKAFDRACDSLNNIGNYEEEKIIAGKALQLIPSNDFQNIANFNFYLGNAYENTNGSDSICLAIYGNTIKFAEKSGKPLYKINALGAMISFVHTQEERDKIEAQIKVAMNAVNDEYLKARALMGLASYSKISAKDGQALAYSIEALEILKKLFQQEKIPSDELAEAYYYVSRAFRNMQQEDKQLAYLKEMRRYIVRNNQLLAYYYLTIGENLFYGKDLSRATAFYDSLTSVALKCNNSLIWNSRLECDLYFAQGYVKYNDNKKALIYAKRANELNQKWGFSYYEANIYYTNGSVYLALKDYRNALAFLQKAEPLAKQNRYNAMYMLCLEKIGKCYGGLNDWKSAYLYSSKFATTQDSLATVNSEKTFAEAEEKYQNKEKQQQIELKNIQLEDAQKQKIWLLSGLGLVMIALILLGIIYRNKRKTAAIIEEKNHSLARLNGELEEANQTKARLFSIIGHDLRSPISQVYQFLKLQQLNPLLLNEDQKSQLSMKIQQATGSLLETMEDLLLWSKTQMNQFKTEFQVIDLLPVVVQSQQLLQLNIDAKNLHLERKIPENIQVKTDQYFLQTIIRNLFQNAVKASPQQGEILLECSQNENSVIFSIQNDGEVFSQEQYEQIIKRQENTRSLSGLGLHLIDELSQKIGASVRFVNAGEGKTRAELILPLN